MPSFDILMETPIQRSARVMQVEGIFDVPPAERSSQVIKVNLDMPETWNIGLIVGPSGSGKTTIASHLWHQNVYLPSWSTTDKSVLDEFPQGMPVKDIVELLCSVGFSSPPSWLRPFHKLSTGEQFRVHVAKILAQAEDVAVVDEFTSVVDRNVAKIASSAVQKTVRKRGQRLVAVSCHYDIIEWLEPDWVYDTLQGETLQRRLLRLGRPPISLRIFRTSRELWSVFGRHHYLSTSLNPASVCFVGFIDMHPVAFSAWLPFFGKGVKKGRREHRTVCLPDYQGVGIGNALSNWCACYWKSLGERVFSTTSHPAMVASRRASPLWRVTREGGLTGKDSKGGYKHATNRFSTGFEYIGAA